MNELNKSWSTAIPSSKKFLSRLLTHHLSLELDRKNFEAVYEGSLDVYNPASEEPDVVVYSRDGGFCPVVALEICKREETTSMAILAKKLLDRYSLKEFFILDLETPCWYRLRAGLEQIDITSLSSFLKLNLDKIVYLYPTPAK